MSGDKHSKTDTSKAWNDYRLINTMKCVKGLSEPRQSESWYSWVIAISCMVVISGTFGIFRSSGVIFAEVIHAFHVDREQASWPFAVSGILNSFSGIVCGPLTTVLPVRAIVILGICGSAFGLGMCSFSSSILWMTVGYGLFFGLGTGLAYICLPMVINDYFKKNKSTGNGILLAGTPLGVIVLAFIYESLITTYALRGTFLFLSAICVQTLVFAALMKPATPPPTEDCNVPNSYKHREEIAEDRENLNGDSNAEDSSLVLDVKDYPRIPISESENDLPNLQKSYPSDDVMNEVYVLVNSSLKSASIDCRFDCIENFEHVRTDAYQKIPSYGQEIENVSTEVILPSCELISSSVREDNVIHVHADVVSAVSGQPERVFYLKKVLILLINPTFLLMTFNFMVTMSAIQTVTIALVDYAEDKGLSRDSAVMLFIAISVPELFSRVCSGWITDKGFMRKEYLLILCQIITGADVFAISLVYRKTALCVLLVLFGIFSSTILVLLNVFCADNFQRELLGFVFGIRHASMIILCLTRPWIIGLFRDTLGSYDYLFQAVGGATALSAFLWAFTLRNNKKSSS